MKYGKKSQLNKTNSYIPISPRKRLRRSQTNGLLKTR